MAFGVATPAAAQDPSRCGDGAYSLFQNRKWSEARAAFSSCGVEGVHYIVGHLRLYGYRSSEELVLEGFLATITGDGVDGALIQLLYDPDPTIRGLAARVLGARRCEAAIPALLERFGDTAETGESVVVTHSNPSEMPVLVQDAALSALERITGQMLESDATPAVKMAAWRSWWRACQAARDVSPQ